MNKTDKKMKAFQRKMCDLAIQIGKAYRFELDYSVDSIKKVEEILADAHNEYESIKHDQGAIHGIALELAAYIITVIEKNIVEGKWEKDHDVFGKNSFPYYLSDKTVIFPLGWCLKRIEGGSTENVVGKFQLATKDIT